MELHNKANSLCGLQKHTHTQMHVNTTHTHTHNQKYTEFGYVSLWESEQLLSMNELPMPMLALNINFPPQNVITSLFRMSPRLFGGEGMWSKVFIVIKTFLSV